MCVIYFTQNISIFIFRVNVAHSNIWSFLRKISSSSVRSESRVYDIVNQRHCNVAAIRLSGRQIVPHTVAKDFLGNSRVLGPRSDHLGVRNPPRACTRYSLLVVSTTTTLVVGTPRGFGTVKVLSILCAKNDTVDHGYAWHAMVRANNLYQFVQMLLSLVYIFFTIDEKKKNEIYLHTNWQWPPSINFWDI